MRRLLIISMIGLSSVPNLACAAVTISEVAWMGSDSSANDEWFELYNDGPAVDVTDWRLTDGAGFDVTFLEAGILNQGSYAVFERTDDASVAGTAFYIYTGALPNSGATLRLYNAEGTLIDQVAGGENWENIGGDNVTKETAQYTARGWQTGAPTPGAGSVATTHQDDVTENKSSAVTSSNRAATSRSATKEAAETVLKIETPQYAFVNQLVDFAPVKNDISWSHRGHDFWWNFGDGSVGQRRESTHIYRYPGTYVVVLRAEQSGEEVIARSEITVLPVTLSITQNRVGDVQLHNTAAYEVDLSKFMLRTQSSEVELPEHTIVLPNQTITIPRDEFKDFELGTLTVLDAQAQIVLVHTQPAQTETLVRADVAVPSPSLGLISDVSRTSDSFSFASQETVATEAPLVPVAVVASTSKVGTQTATAIEGFTQYKDSPNNVERLSYLGLIGVLVLAIVTLVARRIVRA